MEVSPKKLKSQRGTQEKKPNRESVNIDHGDHADIVPKGREERKAIEN